MTGKELLREALQGAPRITQHTWHNGHWYEVEGQQNPNHPRGWWRSVTNVLGAGVPKPFLVPWAQNRALDMVLQEMYRAKNLGLWEPDQIYAKAKAEVEKRPEADAGIAVHEVINQWLRGTAEEVVNPSLEAFRYWLANSPWEVAATELPVFADGIAGTVDLVLYNSGNWVVADIKTGRVYNEAAYQVGAYAYALRLMTGLPFDHALVLQLPRDGSPAKEYHVTDVYEAWLGYKAAELIVVAQASKLLKEV